MENYQGSVRVSSEKQFVHHDSFNRGFVQLPRMIINCLNLSETAKIAYGVISGHVFEHGKSAFPSISRICMSSNRTKKTVIKALDELVDKGFIERFRKGNGKNNDYFLVDMDKVAHLHVSEMTWRAVNSIYKDNEVRWHEQIADALSNFLKKMESEGVEFGSIPVNEEQEKQIKEVLVNSIKEGEQLFNPPNKGKSKPEVQETKETTSKSVKGIGGHGRFCLPDDVDKWKNDNFVQYFYEKYIDATGKTHESARSKHRGMIGRVVRNVGDKAKVKTYIDTFFELVYETPNIEWFSTSGRLTELDTFLEKGKKPFYLAEKEKKEKIESAEQENKGMSADAFLARIKQSN